MILLVASQFDQPAFQLASRWARHQACVLTAQDLSREGWVYSPDLPGEWRGVAGDHVFGATDLTGVLNCLPEVDEHELSHVAAEDRAYVAAEMNAFLVSWQSQLACPVINQPTPNCLVGPLWKMEEWVLTAARLGIPVLRVERRSDRRQSSSSDPLQGARSITVVDDLALGTDEELGRRAKCLARAASVALATFYFSSSSDAELVAVSLRADLENQAIADALLRCFEGVAAC
jgi:hypothetical protein